MWEMDVGGGRIRTDFYCAGAQRGNSPSPFFLRPSVRFGTLLGTEFTSKNTKYTTFFNFFKKILDYNRKLL